MGETVRKLFFIRVYYPEYVKNYLTQQQKTTQMKKKKNEQRTEVDFSPKKMCKWLTYTWKYAQQL